MPKPRLSVVTGCTDRPAHLRRLVDSLTLLSEQQPEIIIADAGDNPLNPSDWPECRVVREYPRVGHAKGYNDLFSRANGDWVTWMNDDAEVLTHHWDTRAIQIMEKNPWIGMGAFAFANVDYGQPFRVEQYHGMWYANFGILKREYGDWLGWFDDEACYCYGADNSLAFKVYLSGKMVMPIPQVRIAHHPILDAHRRRNESGQPKDVEGLIHKYGPLIPQMQHFFKQHRERRVID